MRISSKGEYGLRALFDLAQRYGEGPIQSNEIHLRQGIDENYLNQILILLRKAGMIKRKRTRRFSRSQNPICRVIDSFRSTPCRAASRPLSSSAILA